MLFMVIERYKNQDGRTIYSRMMPESLKVHGSWFSRCFLVIESDDLGLLRQWSPSKEVAEDVYSEGQPE